MLLKWDLKSGQLDFTWNNCMLGNIRQASKDSKSFLKYLEVRHNKNLVWFFGRYQFQVGSSYSCVSLVY